MTDVHEIICRCIWATVLLLSCCRFTQPSFSPLVFLFQSTSRSTPQRRLWRSRRKEGAILLLRALCQTFRRMRLRTWSCSEGGKPVHLSTDWHFLKSRNSILYSYLNKTIFLQHHKDFYCYKRNLQYDIAEYLLLFRNSWPPAPSPPLHPNRACIDQKGAQLSIPRS